MPKIKIENVVSFSSEDPVHNANNILSTDTNKKWKCKNSGERQASIVLQLEKACKITNIDIGNENSAYIEVLVTRSSANEDYKVLLVMTSFMSAFEARQSTNVNKVQMFKTEQLSEPERNEKWDRVKIVCTQPFNRHVQYGLSFVNFYSNEIRPDDNSGLNNPMTIGKFTLRPESPDNISIGSIFSKKKESQQNETLKVTGAAAIREASSSSSLAKYVTLTSKNKIKITPKPSTKTNGAKELPKPRNRNELLYNKDEEEYNEKIDTIVEKKLKENQEAENKLKEEAKKKESTPKNKNVDSIGASSSKTNKNDTRKESLQSKKLFNTGSNKRKSEIAAESSTSGKKQKRNQQYRPFYQLMSGVTLVISGIQNPDRANLRSMALAMGAKYKPDWDNSCTHLICAFQNTPKFNQVKGKGKIVTKAWIEDCHREKKRFPWRRYALDKIDKQKEESEEEIFEETEELSEDIPTTDNTSSVIKVDSGSDTEDEIERIQILQEKKKEDSSPDVFTIDTDSEDYIKPPEKEISVKFKSFFDNKPFYIDPSFTQDTYNLLRKYIVAYKGIFVDDPTENIDVIITNSDNSDTLKEINENAICVKAQWIWECHNNQKLVPMDDYLL